MESQVPIDVPRAKWWLEVMLNDDGTFTSRLYEEGYVYNWYTATRSTSEESQRACIKGFGLDDGLTVTVFDVPYIPIELEEPA